MLTLCSLILIGFGIGIYLRLGAVAVASLIVLSVWTFARIQTQTITTVDLLMLFSYLSALQGGFLLGAYTATRKDTEVFNTR